MKELKSQEKEIFETLFKLPGAVLVKRITSPKNFKSGTWIQGFDECVRILKGSAVLKVKNKTVRVPKGKCLFLKKGIPHKIIRTSGKEKTVWLAVYFK